MQKLNYYEMLGTKPESDSQTIREVINSKIRKMQAQINSPDKKVREAAEKEMRELIKARKILLDPSKRKEYDDKVEKLGLPMVEGSKEQRELALKKTSLNYSIAIFLDTSGSMFGEKIEDAKDALISFLQKVNIEENELALVTFGANKLTWTDGLTQDSNYIKDRIKALADPLSRLTTVTGKWTTPHSGTPMMQAIRTAHEKVLIKRRAKPVMVIATDGMPTDSPEEEILKYATPIKKDGTWIITIGIGEDVNEEFLKRLASSPDDYYFAEESFELKKIYKEIASGLAIRK